ncbi:MAG: hypothetical protein LAQ69_17625 [Acidobacteriia bacterium]|nr:hypothetical protein [Terriglobia bacterium]
MAQDADSRPEEVTGLLRAWRRGDRAAFDQLARIVDTELRGLARRYMARERPDHTLKPMKPTESWLENTSSYILSIDASWPKKRIPSRRDRTNRYRSGADRSRRSSSLRSNSPGPGARLIWILLAATIGSSAAKSSRCWHRRIGPTRFWKRPPWKRRHGPWLPVIRRRSRAVR